MQIQFIFITYYIAIDFTDEVIVHLGYKRKKKDIKRPITISQ